MKKSTKLMTLLMAMVLAMGSLASCGGKEEPAATTAPAGDGTQTETNNDGGTPTEVSLKVWVPTEETMGYEGYGDNLTQTMIDNFNNSQSKWKVNADIKPVSESEAYETATKDPSKAADVMMVAGDNLVQLVDKGIVSPITVADMDQVKANNAENSINAATFEDADLGGEYVYGVPFSPNTWFMFYDKSKYSEDEVKSLETMLAKDIPDTKYNFSMKLEDSWYSPAFFFAAGCTLFGADGKDPKSCEFNNEKGVEAGKYIMNLAKNPKFFPEVAEEVGIKKMEDGELAAWCGGTWNADSIKTALGENYAATVVPTINIGGEDKSMMPYTSFKYIAAKATDDENVAGASQALACWLGGEQCQKDRLIAREVAPTWTSVVNSDEAAKAPAVQATAMQAAQGYIQPSITQMQNSWDAVKAFCTWAVSDKANEKDIQAELDKMVTNILADIKSK